MARCFYTLTITNLHTNPEARCAAYDYVEPAESAEKAWPGCLYMLIRGNREWFKDEEVLQGKPWILDPDMAGEFAAAISRERAAEICEAHGYRLEPIRLGSDFWGIYEPVFR